MAFYKNSGAAIPNALSASSLNQLVMQLPTGPFSMKKLEGWVQKNGAEGGAPSSGGERAAEYRILEVDVTLQGYMQEAFINTLQEPLDVPILTLPVYIKSDRLERLDGWSEWKTLKGFLEQKGLMPFCVFKNTPKNIPRLGTFYLCDIRVGFIE